MLRKKLCHSAPLPRLHPLPRRIFLSVSTLCNSSVLGMKYSEKKFKDLRFQVFKISGGGGGGGGGRGGIAYTLCNYMQTIQLLPDTNCSYNLYLILRIKYILKYSIGRITKLTIQKVTTLNRYPHKTFFSNLITKDRYYDTHCQPYRKCKI